MQQSNSLIEESLKLVKDVIANSIPHEKYAVFNICKRSSYEEISKRLEEYPSIATPYVYESNNLIRFLLQEGVILSIMESFWFVDVRHKDDLIFERFDWVDLGAKIKIDEIGEDIEINKTARQLGYISNMEVIEIYAECIKYPVNDDIQVMYEKTFGPQYPKQYVILISKNNARNFIYKYESIVPQWDPVSNKLVFKGKEMTFEGNKQKHVIEKLLKNVNTLISKETLVEYSGKSLTKTEDSNLSAIVKTIRSKLRLAFGDSIIITSQNGKVGLFINKEDTYTQ